MGTEHKIVRTILWVFLIVTMLVLTRYILFKRSPHYYKDFFVGGHNVQVIKKGWRRANVTPFRMINSMIRYGSNQMTMYKNIGGNIVGFVPLGLIFPLLFSGLRRWHKTTLLIFGISLSFEITQLITGWGMFDIDDLILNTSGGLLGYILFFIGSKIFSPESPRAELQHR
jgi:glycopeptide antibiotics resistance protein